MRKDIQEIWAFESELLSPNGFWDAGSGAGGTRFIRADLKCGQCEKYGKKNCWAVTDFLSKGGDIEDYGVMSFKEDPACVKFKPKKVKKSG